MIITKEKPVEWFHEGYKYRLISQWRKEFEYGYSEPAEHTYNILQRMSLFGWVTVEEEFIPNHVIYSLAFLGDTGGWYSELIVKCRTMGMPEYNS